MKMVQARTAKLLAVVEQAIDEFGLSNVLDAIGGICVEKVEHIQSNWGDDKLAEAWKSATVSVGNAASLVMLKGL